MGVLTSSTFWTAVGSIAGAVLVGFTLIQHSRGRRLSRRLSVFLSIQMSQLDAETYKQTRSEAMELVSVLRRNADVYFLNQSITRLEDFDERSFDGRAYLDEIKKADYFVAIITDRICSSIYCEAGIALALGKPSIYFVTSMDVMPSLMRVIGDDHPRVKVIVAKSLDEITPKISKLIEYELISPKT